MDKTGERVKANEKDAEGIIERVPEKGQCQGHRSRDEFRGWP